MKILLLEDDYLYKISIKEFLVDIGFEVDDFEDGEDALDAVYDNHYDLLLLDIRVPGMSGFELLEILRENNIFIPVIILTSLTDISNLSKGYELGCNDYLKKPFDLIELKYRIEQLIKSNCFSSTENIINLRGYCFDIQKEVLYKNKEPIELTNKESKVISFLVQNRGSYISIESLHENVWENKDVQYAENIRMCIKRIRNKTDKDFIVTKRSVGYKIDK